MKRALISVSDKTGVVEFARGLLELGVEIISTGGTARTLKEAGVHVIPVSEVAGFPEILDGRVKTLQPGIHGGILARRDNPVHMRQLVEHGITPIDLVAVNLYPFKQTIEKPGVSLEEAIENIDIGGPAMVRASAKNYPHVAVIVDPAWYGRILNYLRGGGIPEEVRFQLAFEAFSHTAAYDGMIARYLQGRLAPTCPMPESGAEDAGEKAGGFPERLTLQFVKDQDLRYGENPHQRAAFYRDPGASGPSAATAVQLQGKELSFNNINDANAALELVKEFREPAAVAVKHTNPCGVGTAPALVDAYVKAYEADPVSIFGGIVALNRRVDAATAREIAKIFVEIVIAPGFDEEARRIFVRKKDLRLLETGEWEAKPLEEMNAPTAGSERDGERLVAGLDLKRVVGGLLVQDPDRWTVAPSQWKVVTKAEPAAGQMEDLVFAWKVCKHVKSNAIVVAMGHRTLGVGAGQMNRIDAARYAFNRAGESARGAVLASDAFFPFPDVVEAAAEAGIAAIIQPGGSIRDQDSIEAADRLGLAMVFTGERHFRH